MRLKLHGISGKLAGCLRGTLPLIFGYPIGIERFAKGFATTDPMMRSYEYRLHRFCKATGEHKRTRIEVRR